VVAKCAKSIAQNGLGKWGRNSFIDRRRGCGVTNRVLHDLLMWSNFLCLRVFADLHLDSGACCVFGCFQ